MKKIRIGDEVYKRLDKYRGKRTYNAAIKALFGWQNRSKLKEG